MLCSVSHITILPIKRAKRLSHAFVHFVTARASSQTIKHQVSPICKSEKRRKAGAKFAVHKDENCFLSDPTWAQDVCVKRSMSLSCLLYQTVMWPLCNYITRVQQARLLASRGCVRFARRPSLHWEKFQKSTHAHMSRSFDSSNPSYSYPEISTVTRRHCAICQVNSSRSAQYPCQALISICGISHVPALLFRCHSDSHRSWLMTSLKSRVNMFHLTTCSLFRCHCACCAAVCSRVYQEW